MRPKLLLLFLFALALPATVLRSGDAPAAPAATLQGDAARPAAARWLRTELYFAIALDGAPDSGAEAKWRAFLDQEVTPRFPDGLTVFDAYGQWQNRAKGTIGRLHTKVLVILHEDTADRQAAIDAIRLAWKKATHDQSVLKVSQPAEVSF